MARLLERTSTKGVVFMLVAALSLCNALGSVPLLIWSNEREIRHGSALPLGHQFSMAEVKSQLSYFLDPSREKIIFLQDKLSLDDFTKYKGKPYGSKPSVFSNIQTLIESNVNMVVPSMIQDQSESSFISYMKATFHNNVMEIYSSDIESWSWGNFKEGQNILHIFHLPPVKRSTSEPPFSNSERSRMSMHELPMTGISANSTETGIVSLLSQNDDIVGKILAHFQKKLKYVAMLTASEPSEMVDKMETGSFTVGKHGIKRHLLGSSTPSSSGKLFNFKGCVFLYASSIDFTVGNVTVNMLNANYTLSGHCASNETSVSIVFGKGLPADVTQFELRMNFAKLENTDWTCISMDTTYSGKLNGTTVTGVNVIFPSCHEKIMVPRDLSYSCGDFSLKNDTTVLSFGHFQVQPFGLKNDRFSNAFDCVGFFTTPILTGVFVTALLVTIAFGGIIAMMGISTMDRFDDPKGPTIQVPHE